MSCTLPRRPPDPWHRRLGERLPRSLRRLVLGFEVRIEEEVERFAAGLPAASRVLDAGAGECRHAGAFAHCRYVGVDLGVGDSGWDYSRLHVLADLTALPFPDATFDAALNIVVLEHCRDPAQVLGEICRVLRPGGRLLLVAPQDWGVHQIPHDYYRYTRYGLRALLAGAGLEVVSLEAAGGRFTVLGRRALEAVLFFQGGWRWLCFLPALLLGAPAGFLLPLLDRLDAARDTTLGHVCVARRVSSIDHDAAAAAGLRLRSKTV